MRWAARWVFTLLILILSLLPTVLPAWSPLFGPTPGATGTCVREPALVAVNGTLLALAHRRYWQGDGCMLGAVTWPRPGGDNRTQLVLRRSTSSGATWSAEETVGYGIGASTVVDAATGTVVVHFCAAQPGRRWPWASDWCMHEATHGTMYQLTSSTLGLSWRRQHIGPSLGHHDGILPSGHGTQAGSRLLFAGQKILQVNDSYSSAHGVIWASDTGAKAWKVVAFLGPGFGEPSLATLPDGTVLLSMRDEYPSQWGCHGPAAGSGCRLFRRSTSRGDSWSTVEAAPSLVSAGVMGSILSSPQPTSPDRVLLAYPYSADPPQPNCSRGRANITLHTSRDGAGTWGDAKVLYAGPSGYSSLARQGGGVVILYERDSAGEQPQCAGESCVIVFERIT